MVLGIERRNDCQQCLSSTYIGSGFLAPDMLFSCLQCQSIGGVSSGINRQTNQTAGYISFVFIRCCKEGRVWPAKTHRNTESLRTADRDINPYFTRWCDQCQREQIGGYYDHDAGIMCFGYQRTIVPYDSLGVGALQQYCALVAAELNRVIFVYCLHLDTQWLGASANDIEGLWMAVLRHEDTRFFASLCTKAQGDCLSRCGRFIQHRCIGNGQSGQLGDQGLKVKQNFESALGYLGLVGRVSGVPRGVFEHIALHDCRCDGAIVALAYHRSGDNVLLPETLQFPECVSFRQWRLQIERCVIANAVRNDAINQVIKCLDTDTRKHRLDVLLCGANMASLKRICHTRSLFVTCYVFNHYAPVTLAPVMTSKGLNSVVVPLVLWLNRLLPLLV